MTATTMSPSRRRLQRQFESLEHGTSGVAQAIDVRGGRRVLTLTEVETSAGPDLRVVGFGSAPLEVR